MFTRKVYRSDLNTIIGYKVVPSVVLLQGGGGQDGSAEVSAGLAVRVVVLAHGLGQVGVQLVQLRVRHLERLAGRVRHIMTPLTRWAY